MKELIYIIVTYFIVTFEGQASAEQSTIRPCTQTSRIIVAVNLVDEECLKKSTSGNSNFSRERENSIEMTEIEMDMYAVCMLKKSSILNDEGTVNVNFNIMKIVKHLYKKTDDKGFGMMFIIKFLERCRYLSGKDQFATATKIMKCLLDNQETIIWCNRP